MKTTGNLHNLPGMRRPAIVIADPAATPQFKFNIYVKCKEVLTDNNPHWIVLRSMSVIIIEMKSVWDVTPGMTPRGPLHRA
jgi:hypothetical protein